MKNLERHKNDLEKLIKTGEDLFRAMRYECDPEGYRNLVRQELKDKASEFLDSLPNFSEEYETWYSEAKTFIRQLLPDRLDDFVGHYENPKTRNNVTYESYRISDYLMGLQLVETRGSGTKKEVKEVIVGIDAAIPRFKQQLAIVKASSKRFESSLFNIKQIVQANLFDSELEAAMALVNHGFLRAGGAIAGVVMEKHLAEVCKNHKIEIKKKTPTIADFNEALKNANVIDLPQWRSNQYLSDLRNLCDHNKKKEPSEDEVTDLINGVMKLTKTLF
ncbi:MAG: hypothetical protein OXI02_04865 [Candidatus Dadabacteria bacterium]|nr:hypothetical protein [Candidatus Dadabacteria bacterium]MDE0477377.1 hypothetical protein [Candidatus Dadabacteria bacterium]